MRRNPLSMANKIKPTGRQKSIFLIHLVIFAIVNAILWYMRSHQMQVEKRWVYPTAAWITAAWGLAVIGHWCSLWTSYEDPGHAEQQRQAQNG